MNLNKDILSLAIPSILANITVPLVGMADIAVAGHLPGSVSGAAFIGGITIGTMLFDLLYWNFAFLRSGTGGLTAQAYGASLMPHPDSTVMPDPDRASQICHILHRALRIAIISGVALIALQWVILWLAFLFVDCSPEVRELATQYFKIRVWAAPATLSLFAFKGWFIGLQDTVRPMIADLLVNGLNILLSFGLGFGLCGLPRLGFAGVAAGTVIAQWSGFLYAALAARRRLGPGQPRTQKRPFLFPQRSQRAATDTESGVFVSAAAPSVIPGPDTVIPGSDPESPSFFHMNRDLVLRAVGMIAVYIGFTVISARFGDTMLAVSSILMKLLLVFSYFTDGFAYAGEALTGRFIGAKDPLGVKTTIRGCFLWGWGLAGAFMLLYGFGGVPAFRLLTSDMTVVEAGREFIPWLLLMPLIGVPAFIWDGIFTGATATGPMRDSTLLCAVGFFAVWFGGAALASAINGSPVAGPLAIHILMAAYFTHLAIRSAYLTGKRWKITGCK